MEEAIAKIINDNLGNRLTMELGQGMYVAILNVIKAEPEIPEEE